MSSNFKRVAPVQYGFDITNRNPVHLASCSFSEGPKPV